MSIAEKLNSAKGGDFTSILGLLLAVLLTVALTGCSGDQVAVSSHSTAQSSQSSAEVVASESSAESSSSSAAVSSQSGSVDMSGGQAYQAADGIVGGQLYSKFWANETGFELNNSNLDSQAQLDSIEANADFFRCKQCHGWDRLGREGGYSNRAPSTTRPRVADVNLARISEIASPQALFNSIKGGDNYRSVNDRLDNYDPVSNASVGDKMPNYAEILTDAQIWDIVKYLKEEALDTTALYDLILLSGEYPSRGRGFLNMGVDGSPIAGDTVYANNCAICHGVDGTKILVDGDAYTVGRHMRFKPYEDQHKVKFGHLGSIMGPVLKDADLGAIQDLFAAMRDKEKYPDVKPEPEPEPEPEPDPDPEPQPIDGQFQFLKHCSSCHSGNGEGASPRYGDVTGASASFISAKIQSVPKMAHLKPDDPAQAVSLEEVDAIAEFLMR